MAEMFKCVKLLPALLGAVSVLAWVLALLSPSWGLTSSTSTGPSGAPGPNVYTRLGLFSAWRVEGTRKTRVDIKQANGVLFAMGRVAVTGAVLSSAAVALTTFTALLSPPCCLTFSPSLTLQLLALCAMVAAWLGAVCAIVLAGGAVALGVPVSVSAGGLALGVLSAFALWRVATTGAPPAEVEEDAEEARERLMEDDIETEID